MNKQSRWKRFENYLLMILGLLFFCSLLYSAFKPAKQETITFNITGINTENQNASTLVAIHFECIKYCVDHVGDYRSLCYEQCAKLGQEGCGE